MLKLRDVMRRTTRLRFTYFVLNHLSVDPRSSMSSPALEDRPMYVRMQVPLATGGHYDNDHEENEVVLCGGWVC